MKKKNSVFGGGRWARVLLGVFFDNTGPLTIFTVHTKHFVEDLCTWAYKNGFMDRVLVTDAEPEFPAVNYKAAVVANAVNDHKEMAEIALATKVPILVEKPMTPCFAETSELIQMAKDSDSLL